MSSKERYSVFSRHNKTNKLAHGENSNNNVASSEDQFKNKSKNSQVGQHQLSARGKNGTILLFCFIITFLFSGIEGSCGYLIHSIALQTDALHMLSDAAGLLIAYFANSISKRPATTHLSFGYGKAEIIGALINCMFTTILTFGLLIKAVSHMLHPVPIEGGSLFIVASLALLVNAGIAYALSRSNLQSLNTKSAFLHALGDLLASLCAVVAGIVIYFTNWQLVDPILSLLIIILLTISNYRLMKKSIIILMAGVPDYLNYEEVGQDLLAVEGIKAVHDLHIWYLTATTAALAAHVLAVDPIQWPQVLKDCQSILLKKHAIEHITLQCEYEDQH